MYVRVRAVLSIDHIVDPYYRVESKYRDSTSVQLHYLAADSCRSPRRRPVTSYNSAPLQKSGGYVLICFERCIHESDVTLPLECKPYTCISSTRLFSRY